MALPERVQAQLPVPRLLAEAAEPFRYKKSKMWCIFRGVMAQPKKTRFCLVQL